MRGIITFGVSFLALLAVAAPQPSVVWGGPGSGPGQFSAPTGVAVAANGEILVVDQGNQRVQVFTPEGKFLRQFQALATGGNLFKLPDRIAAGPDGSLFVTDFGAHCVFKFSPDGKLLDAWGGKGGTLGRLDNPKGVCVNAKGEVYVADTGNQRVQKFSPQGEALGRYFKYSMRPVDMVELEDGKLLAVTTFHVGSFWTFKGDGELVGAKWHYGNLPSPTAVDLDGDGSLYLSSADDQIYHFRPDGARLAHWGERGDAPGQFKHPADLALDHRGGLYVVDKYNNRVQKFLLDSIKK